MTNLFLLTSKENCTYLYKPELCDNTYYNHIINENKNYKTVIDKIKVFKKWNIKFSKNLLDTLAKHFSSKIQYGGGPVIKINTDFFPNGFIRKDYLLTNIEKILIEGNFLDTNTESQMDETYQIPEDIELIKKQHKVQLMKLEQDYEDSLSKLQDELGKKIIEIEELKRIIEGFNKKVKWIHYLKNKMSHLISMIKNGKY